MKYGVIIRNIVDLRAKPDFRSERKSQLLYNEPLEIGRGQKGYCKVHQTDGYSGWVDIRCMRYITRKEYERLIKRDGYFVISQKAKVTQYGKSSELYPTFLFYGTKLNVIKKSGNYGVIMTPNGGGFKIALKNLLRRSQLKEKDFHPRLIIREARKFLGTPYLWGGVSPYGFDCSGLVQKVYARFGIYLPRDSKDQRKEGCRIAEGKIKRGDLLFYPGHVSIAIDKYRIIHSSLAEGGVAVNSMNPEDSDFRKDLFDTFLEARRVIK